MDRRNEIREFLTSRRAKITPEQAGLRTFGDDTERAHLFDLARATRTATTRTRRRSQQLIRPSVQYMLDAMSGVPAFVRNGRLDILGANSLGRALYAGQFDSPVQPPNKARFFFLDSRRAGLEVRAGAEPACQLDGDTRSGKDSCRSRGTAPTPSRDLKTGSPARC
jgi:hypothetical protein